MAEEETGVETAGNVGDLIASESVADNTDGQTEETPQEPAQEPVTEGKTDNRDFQVYSKKLEAENRELRDMVKQRQQETAQPQYPPQYAPQYGAEMTPEQEAVQLLAQIVGEEVGKAMSPLTEERIWDAFEKQPYVAELKPEIAEELAKLPENMPLESRLDTARKNAIVNNLGTIAKVYTELGRDEAYGNQQVKRTNTGLGATPTRTGQQPSSVVDRVLAGETVSDSEYRENHVEIQEAMRKQAMG